jgi:predicted secreted protein
MDTIASMTLTQSLLFWILLGFLLIWMVTFAVLAVLSRAAKKDGDSDSHNVPIEVKERPMAPV